MGDPWGAKGFTTRMRTTSKNARGTATRLVLTVLAALAAMLGLVLVPVAPAAAAIDSSFQITKTASSSGPFGPGDTFSYTINVVCSSPTSAGCVNAAVADTLPAPLVLDGAYPNPVTVTVAGGGVSSQVNLNGSGGFQVLFTQPLGGGTGNGLPQAKQATITVHVRVPADASADYNGTLPNTARATADNANPATSVANVTLNVPSRLEVQVEKERTTEATIPAVPGRPVHFDLTATNASNQSVDTLVIQDPTNVANPTSGPFQYLQLTGFDPFDPPQGADEVQVEWLDASGTWQTSYDGAIPADSSTLLPTDTSGLYGVRVTFRSTSAPDIPQDAQATIGLDTETRDNVTDIDGSATVENTVTSHVEDNGVSSDPDTSEAAVTITNQPPTVTTTKSFDTDDLTGGESATATIRTTTGDQPVHEMTISEPGPSGDDLHAQGLVFGGFVDDDIEWPVAATQATITYTYANGDTETIPTDEVGTLPAPTTPADVVGFSVTFTAPGDGIEANSYAVLPFTVTADPVPGTTPVTSTNTTRSTVTDSEGRSTDASGQDTLTRLPAQVDTNVTKRIQPSEIYAAPGSIALVSLAGNVAPRPDSTVGSDYLQITDPANPTATPSEFWSCFQIRNITNTDIPAGTTLTVEGWDGTQWVPLATQDGQVSNWSYVVPAGERAGLSGIRFTYTRTDDGTLAPGFNVAPNFYVEMRADCASSITTDTTYGNDVESEVANEANDLGPVTDQDDDDVLVHPIDGGGPGPDLVEKTFYDPDLGSDQEQVTVGALTDGTQIANLRWSTEGLPFDTVTISDPASTDELTNVKTSVYDAFDVTRILPITASQDPWIGQDQITAVQGYSATDAAWVDLPGGCDNGCSGGFGGYDIPAGDGYLQQGDLLGVRLVFASRTSGEPVAMSFGHDRLVRLEFKVRDTLRSEPTQYVLGQYHPYTYNTTDPGLVNNTVRVTGEGAVDVSSDDDARIQIVDRPLNVGMLKSFEYSPLGLPPAGTPQEDYPLVDSTLVATNQTASKVSGLSITDPAPGTAVADSVFDTLNLYAINSIGVPANLSTSDVDVTLIRDTGPTVYTYAAAIALTEDDLDDVIGLEVSAQGRWVQPDQQLRVSLTWQLRATERTSDAPMTTTDAADAPVHTNVAQSEVQGPGGILCSGAGDAPCDSTTATDQDSFEIAQPSYGVNATKAIDPTSRYEDQSRTGYTATLSGQPTGTARTTLLTLTDDDPRFWNAFDFNGVGAFTPTGPVNQLRLSWLGSDDTNTLTYELDGGDLVARCNGAADLDPCWHVGDWSPQGATIRLDLPSGVDPGQVRGVRVDARSFKNGQVVQWERPNNPKVTIELSVTRRENLWWSPAGDDVTPVPSTLPGMTPAPGEPTQGTTHDQLVVDGTASWTDGSGANYHASDDASAATQLLHRVNKIRVQKSPGNPATAPLFENGGTVPYVMTVTNTGAYTMTAPTFTVTDQITPVGGSSPVTAPDGDASFTFALVNANGAAQSTAGIAGHLDAATGLVTVTFPNGFRFPPGWKLTISASLEVRDDLPAGTEIDNSVTASSDRDFEECRYTTDSTQDHTTGSSTNPVPTCTATTTVEVQATSPLEITKRVRGEGAGLPDAGAGEANHDDLGVWAYNRSDTSDCEPGGEGAADADGYYTWPCAPITRPGGTERWRMDMENHGNVNASVIAGIDVLPAVDDQGVIVPVDRGSEFDVTLLNDFGSNLSSLSDGAAATLTVYYTTTVPDNACNDADIRNSTAPGGLAASDPCYGDVTGRSWQQVTAGADLSAAKAVKYVVTFGDATDAAETRGLAPGETFQFEMATRTPAQLDTAPERASGLSVAWNSVAAGSRSVAAGNQRPTSSLVSEPRQVGVAVPTGELRLTKLVDAPDWAVPIDLPESYTFGLACDSAGETDIPLTGPDGDADLSTVTIAPGETLDYNDLADPSTSAWSSVNLPWGATCTVTEDQVPTGAEVTYDPADQTVTALRDLTQLPNVMDPVPAPDTDELSLTATNTYTSGGFTVTKTVDNGGAVDQDGNPVEYGPFSFTATCTFLGQEALPAEDQAFDLEDGESFAVDDLPTGADCTVTETADDGAAATSVVVTKNGTAQPAQDGHSVDFTIAQGDATTIAAAYTNTFTTGSVQVTKNVTGPGADAWGNETFTLHLVCTLDGDTVYDADHEVSKADPVWTVDNVPTGAECVVTEPEDGGANSSSLDPADGTVTVGDGTTVEVEVTNTFTLGALTVSKKLIGPAASDPGALTGRYTMQLACTREVNGETVDVPIPGGDTQTLIGEGSYTWTGLPTGATCSIDEVASVPKADNTLITPSSVVIGDDESDPVQVEVLNAFGVGSLELHKEVAGDAASFAPDSFEVQVTCRFPELNVALPNDGVVDLPADGTPVTLDGIPSGAVCTTTEADAGQTSTDISPDPVTIGNDTTVSVTVTNTYDAGSFVIVKDLDGVGAMVARGPFTFAISCTFNGETFTPDPATVSLEVEPGEEQLTSDPIDGLPVGADCTVTETDAGNAVKPAKPVEVTVTEGSAETPVLAELTNRFGAGILVLEKRAKGTYADSATLEGKQVTLHVVCVDGPGASASTVVDRDVKVPLDAKVTLSDSSGDPELLPVGSRCWATETDTLDASDSSVDHGTRADAVVIDSVSAGTAQQVSITAVNTYDTPPDGTPPTQPQPPLPNTGSTVEPWMVALAALLLAAGTGLIVSGRRRRG